MRWGTLQRISWNKDRFAQFEFNAREAPLKRALSITRFQTLLQTLHFLWNARKIELLRLFDGGAFGVI